MADKEKMAIEWPVIGHSNIISYLQNNLAQKQVAHAYLFTGLAHLGKTTVAKNFLQSLVCRNFHQDQGSVPCGQCDCCLQVANQIHPDIYFVSREVDEKTGKTKKNISVEQIRSLQNQLSLCSFLDSYRIAIVNEAQTMSLEAANALLKTLEEPGAKTVIILLADSQQGLPATIVSRCQVLKFRMVSGEEIFNYLISQKIDRKKAKVFSALSFGRPGLALDYAFSESSYEELEDEIKQFLVLIKANLAERFKMVSELTRNNDVDGLARVLLVWQEVMRDLLLIKLSAQQIIANLNLANAMSETASRYSLDQLKKLFTELEQTKKNLAQNINPKLALENLVLNF